jgi:hypothetical protein
MSRTGLIWLLYGEVAGCCEDSEGPSGSIKCEKLFCELTNSYVLEKNFLHGVSLLVTTLAHFKTHDFRFLKLQLNFSTFILRKFMWNF